MPVAGNTNAARAAQRAADAILMPTVLEYLDAVFRATSRVQFQPMAAELGYGRDQLLRLVGGYTKARPLVTPAGRKLYYRRANGRKPGGIVQSGWV